MRKPIPLDEAALTKATGGSFLAGSTGSYASKGGEGSDTLAGAANHDWLSGNGGDDLLNGAGGDDLLEGGAGQDTLLGGAGDDRMTWLPGDGNDSIEGGEGHDTLFLPESAVAEITVTLADGTLVQPSERDGVMGYWLPPGAAGTVTIGGASISFTGLERIVVGEMPEIQVNTRQG